MMSFVYKLVFLFCAINSINCKEVLVKVEQGWLRGKLVTSVTKQTKFASFKGIPYAAPPVGDLRFKAPQDPTSWSGIRNAIEHGSMCTQVTLLTNKLQGSEDCLFLNVYSPNIIADPLLPVIVYIHGGFGKFGSGNDDVYGPDFLVEEDVVVVTLNYRLDALGFLSMDSEEVPGNAALKDQLKALQWVNRNIAFFGGDPNKVTLYGHCTGAMSVGLHMVSPLSAKLFQRAIVSNGSPLSDNSLSYKPVERAFLLGKTLGFDTKSKAELLTFLQNVPNEKLVNTPTSLLLNEANGIYFKMQDFSYVIEKDFGDNNGFITEDVYESLAMGRVNKADLLWGYNARDTVIIMSSLIKYVDLYGRYKELFAPSKILTKCGADKILEISDKIIEFYFGDKNVNATNIIEFTNYFGNSSIIYDMNRFFGKWHRFGKSYFTKISLVAEGRNYFSQLGNEYGMDGASAYDDIAFTLDAKNPAAELGPTNHRTTLDNTTYYAHIKPIVKGLTNFVKYGNPTPDSSLGVIWPQHNELSHSCMHIGKQWTVVNDPETADNQFWKSILDYAGYKY